jgi:CRP-like cAMP-binding protein
MPLGRVAAGRLCDDDAHMPRTRTRPPTAPTPVVDLRAVLESAPLPRTVTKYSTAAVIFSQGDNASDVFYLQDGSIKLSVLSRTGKEAVIAVLGPGDFFGEGCLAGQERRMATASAMAASTVLAVEKAAMLALLHEHQSIADQFLRHMLQRNIRIEEDLVDLLFNSSEKRLARALLLLARYGKADAPLRVPKMSQETLAEIVGTTRSRINFFLNKFRDLGFIEYNGDITINRSLLTVVLHE